MVTWLEEGVVKGMAVPIGVIGLGADGRQIPRVMIKDPVARSDTYFDAIRCGVELITRRVVNAHGELDVVRAVEAGGLQAAGARVREAVAIEAVVGIDGVALPVDGAVGACCGE